MLKSAFNTPVLFIIFNRPETTQLVFNAIRNIKPVKLYVAADGPRPGVSSDVIQCELTRKIIEQVDWDCDVKTLFRDKNLNCGVAPSSAMSWLFENESQGIILEDDCLPSESFFWFCQELLERYKDDNRVMHIGGNNFLNNGQSNAEHSYHFSRNGHIWGWATWRRAWKMYDYEIKLYEKIKARGYFDDFFLNWLERTYRLRKFDETFARKGVLDWWDYQWDFTRYINSGLSIVPQKNLVKNLGFGEGATHTTNRKNRIARLEAHDLDFPLKHPPFVMRDIEKDKLYFSNFMRDTILAKLSVYIP